MRVAPRRTLQVPADWAVAAMQAVAMATAAVIRRNVFMDVSPRAACLLSQPAGAGQGAGGQLAHLLVAVGRGVEAVGKGIALPPVGAGLAHGNGRSEEHTSELQSPCN